MPGGGTLRITSDTVEVDPASGLPVPPGRYVRLGISDSGSGMPADVAAQAFDPFFTTKPTGEGTGLGLATVYGLVNRAGGHVELSSKPGHGTEVDVYLPEAEGPPTAEELEATHRVYRPGAGDAFQVRRTGPGAFRVEGEGVERLIARHDIDNEEALRYIEGRLRGMGVIRALGAAGFTPGDDVEIAGTMFELDPAAPLG